MSASGRQRIDTLLVSKGFAENRTRAAALVMAGKVFSGGTRVEKAGTMVRKDVHLEIRDDGDRWVSRGALKLLKGLDSYGICPRNLVCADLGASTGGFTHVLLERGARMVYSVDVGYGQLAWSLRQDERVIVMERTNARSLTPDDFPEPPELAAADLSFISLRLVIPAVRRILTPEGQAVLLVKPQFEIGKGRVGKGGVVRSKEDHEEVLREITGFIAGEGEFYPAGLTFSPLRGPMGNIEYLLHAVSCGDKQQEMLPFRKVVEEAHLFFQKEGK